jgi:hypothetical protein
MGNIRSIMKRIEIMIALEVKARSACCIEFLTSGYLRQDIFEPPDLLFAYTYQYARTMVRAGPCHYMQCCYLYTCRLPMMEVQRPFPEPLQTCLYNRSILTVESRHIAQFFELSELARML